MTCCEFEENLQKTYEFVRLLHSSGKGKVFLIRHRTLKEKLVVRLTDRPLPAYERLKSVAHPNLVRVLDVIALEDGYAELEEALSGITVEEVLETGLYRYRGAKAVLAEVCQGLSFLHEAGFIHRDVKTSNVMILDNGHCKLLDYDAARIIAPTSDTVRLGTPGYAAPEQYVGSSSVETDIYALGVLLNVMLTGRHPSEVLTRNLRARRIVLKATAVHPSRRFASAEEFRRAL